MKSNRKYLYVLECEDDCYYVGQTNDLVNRFRQHKEQGDEGSVWTSNHKPIRIIEEWNIENYSNEDAINFEDKLTIEYINKFGWESVRGGKYIYFDPERHFNLLNKYNNLVDGIFVLKATESKIEHFLDIKDKINSLSLSDDKAYIYVLHLMNDRYYIGRSNKLLKEIRKHCYADHRKWTTLNSPIELVEVIEDTDLGVNHPCPHRNEVVFQYMRKYGWNNVRGGDFVLIDEENHYKLIAKKKPSIL